MKITIENHNEDKVQEYQGGEEEVKQSLLKDFPWLFNAEAPSDLRDMILEVNSSQMYSVVGIQPKQFANAVAQRMEEDPEEEIQPSSDAPAEPLPEGDFFDQDYLNPEISNMHAYRQFVANDPQGYHIYLASDSIKEILEKEGVKQHNDILIAIAKMINQSASTTEEQGKTFRIGHDAYYVYFPSKTGALKFLYNLNAIVNEIPTLYSVHPYFDVGVGDSMENAYHALSQVQHMKIPNKDKGNHVVLHTEEGTRYLSPEDNDAAGMIKSESLAKMAKIHDDPQNPKLVYRWENEKGVGPWQGDYRGLHVVPADMRSLGLYDWVNGLPPMKTPDMDFPADEWREKGRDYQWQHLFGYSSPQGAVQHVGPEHVQELYKQGFHLAAHPASTVYLSNSGQQVYFKPAQAEPNNPRVNRLFQRSIPHKTYSLDEAMGMFNKP